MVEGAIAWQKAEKTPRRLVQHSRNWLNKPRQEKLKSPMSEPAFSVIPSKDGRVIFRLYVNIHRSMTEYYEVTMPRKDARLLGIDLLTGAETAERIQGAANAK